MPLYKSHFIDADNFFSPVTTTTTTAVSTAAAVAATTTTTTAALLEYLNIVTTLNIRSASRADVQRSIARTSLTRTGCIELFQSLMGTPDPRISDIGLHLLLRNNGTLLNKTITNLDLSASISSGSITDYGLNILSHELLHLRSLDLSGALSTHVTAAGLRSLLLQLRELADFSLAEFNSGNFDVIIRGIFMGLRCPKMARISLRRCAGLCDAGLACVAAACPGLRSLDIRSCGLVTTNGIAAFVKAVPCLNVFKAGLCPGVTDSTLALLGSVCAGSLRTLDLARCWNITDLGLKSYMGKSCPALRNLDITGCKSVSDTAVLALAESCKNIRRIKMGGCDVGIETLEKLVVSCPELELVNVRGCKRILMDEAVRVSLLTGIKIVF